MSRYKNRPEFYSHLSQPEFKRLIHYSSWISEKHRFLYLETPKAACTKIKSLLYRADGYNVPDNLKDIHSRNIESGPSPKRLRDFSYGVQEQILFSDDWYRFGFVRNPYNRLQSSYVSKIYSDRTTYVKDINEQIFETLGYHVDSISFELFVNTVCSQKDLDRNTHWCTQTRALFNNFIPYNHLGQVEHFADDIIDIFNDIGIDAGSRKNLNQKINQSQSFKNSLEYSKELAQLVYTEYEKDFHAFNYSSKPN